MKNPSANSTACRNRRGATVVLTAVMLVFLFAMAAFAIEVGMMMVARTNTQAAVDAAALAGASVLSRGQAETAIMAKQYAAFHDALGEPIQLTDDDIKIGFWDDATNTFSVDVNGNAVQVVGRISEASLFFGRAFGQNSFSTIASSVAVAPARDIVFVVDLSGSMNDDTEPVWATKTINDVYASTPYSGVANTLMQKLFSDFGYGSYPGTLSHIGFSLNVPADRWAYAEMTRDYGYLDTASVAAQYRIVPSDSEWERKEKCYRYIIDQEIAIAMPGALPVPDSSVNYDYWAKYLDYVITSEWVHSKEKDKDDKDDDDPPPVGLMGPHRLPSQTNAFQFAKFKYQPRVAKPDSTPRDRGWIPPVDGYERMYHFNNPSSAFASPDYDSRWDYGKKLGYLTYVNFMQDFGRDEKPDGVNYVPLSVNSPHCPLHNESTDGGDFSFPPATQPMHSCRRALISALNVIKERNEYSNPDQKDRVAIITFDQLDAGTTLVQSLTEDYQAAMQVCTTLQATVDIGASTSTEIGLSAAFDYVKQQRDGGMGRNNVNKVIVMLTDGLPNAYESSDGDIDMYQSDHPSDNYYESNRYALDAPLMQTKIMSRKGWQVHPVGIGFGTDYDFMDRVARIGGTAQGGQSLRGSGNPALYEERLRELFQEIVEDPMVNLAK